MSLLIATAPRAVYIMKTETVWPKSVCRTATMAKRMQRDTLQSHVNSAQTHSVQNYINFCTRVWEMNNRAEQISTHAKHPHTESFCLFSKCRLSTLSNYFIMCRDDGNGDVCMKHFVSYLRRVLV